MAFVAHPSPVLEFVGVAWNRPIIPATSNTKLQHAGRVMGYVQEWAGAVGHFLAIQ